VNSNLTPSSHIASITVTANQRVNVIYRSFVSRDINLLVRAFITYVRPILEYNSVTWSPYYKSDIEWYKGTRWYQMATRFQKSYIQSAFKTPKFAQS